MSWFIKIFSSILAVFIFSSSAEIPAYSPIDKDNMLTSFTVISDAHLEGNNRQKHTLLVNFCLILQVLRLKAVHLLCVVITL